MTTASIVTYFLPIFSFLLVFIVCYAILQKTKVLGNNSGTSLLISLILASFFIVETQLSEFIQFTSSWISVIVIILFFLFVILAFIPGKEPLKFISDGWFGWVVLALVIIFFITSATYVFHWTINLTNALSWMQKDWFQFLLLIIISIVVAGVLKKE